MALDPTPAADSRATGEIQQRILDAAAVQFRRHGLRSTTMGRIADESGILRANIYRYFPSKFDLLLEVLIQDTRILHQQRATARKLDGPVGRIMATALFKGHLAARDDELMKIALSGEIADLTAELIRTDRHLFAAECEFWQPLLDYGRSRGELRLDLDDTDITRWFFRSQFMILTSPHLFESTYEVMEHLERFVVPAVLAPGQSSVVDSDREQPR